MSRILLISSNTAIDPYPVYPVGMAMVASALAQAGHAVRQFDCLADGAVDGLLQQTISAFSPDYVGISVRNIDNVDSFTTDKGWYLAADQKLVKMIRGLTKAPVILGGPGFSVMAEEILAFLGADYGITGEGEKAVCDLVEGLEQGRSMPVITRIDGCRSHEITSCHPLWEPGLIGFYARQSGMISMQTKRGCPHRCAYCTYPAIEGSTIRYRDPDDIADEVERVGKTFGVDTFYFTDSVFNDNAQGYLNIAETLLRRQIKVKWAAFFRPEGVSADQLSLLKRAGLYAVEAGSDASTDETLSGLNKHFTFDDVLEFNEACTKAQVPCAHYIVFGGPEETEATVAKGLKNLEMLKSCIVFVFSGLRILPQTLLQGQAIKDGILDPKDSLLTPKYYFSPTIDQNRMNESLLGAFQGRRDRIFPPSQGLMMAQKMNSHGYYGLLWDRLIVY